MKRRLFNILSALSLVACIACAVLWVRGGFVIDGLLVGYGNNGRELAAESRAGILYFMVRQWSPPRQGLGLRLMHTTPRLPRAWVWYLPLWDGCPPRFLWFRCAPLWYRSSSTYAGEGVLYSWVLVLPCWLLTLTTAVPPTIWTVFYRRGRQRMAYRASRGLCLKCGYDLRASKERCPECGTAITADSEAGGEPKAI